MRTICHGVVALSCAALLLSAASAQSTMNIKMPGGSEETVGVFKQKGMLFGSVNDLADAFSLDLNKNERLRMVEIAKPPRRMKVFSRNPFLVVIDQSQRQHVYQMPVDAVHSTGISYAPLSSFLPIFSDAFNTPVKLDAISLRADQENTSANVVIGEIAIEQKSNGMLIRLACEGTPTEYESWLRDDGWLYVTVGNASADVAALNKTKPSGLVQKVVAIQSRGSLQLTFKLNGKIAASEIMRHDASDDLLLSVRTPGAGDKALLEKKRHEIQEGLQQQRKRWGLDVIVLDAGHGGHDHGASGVKGVREKDVTLNITLKLGKLIEKGLPGVKVVYTRKNDIFIPLYRRGQIANEANGRLFISVHANSLRKKPNPTRGFEVYLLRPGRTDEAINIAERENSVIELEENYADRYQKLTDENFILVTMAQSAYMRASEVFAQVVTEEMEDHLSIPNRGVRQAGFLVLVGASMPNVLIETAYLSNREDERFLASKDGQQKIAESIFNGIKRYKEEYEKLLEEGKDLGAGD